MNSFNFLSADGIYRRTRDTTQLIFNYIYGKSSPPPPPPPPPPPRLWISGQTVFLGFGLFLGLGMLGYGLNSWEKGRKRRKVGRGKKGEKIKEIVVVTGADTPMGRSVALYLEKQGFIVFASGPGEELIGQESKPNLRSLIIDITKPESVIQAAQTISAQLSNSINRETYVLAGIVQAANISIYGPLETISYDLWQRALNINVLGTVLLVQKFLPILRKNRHHPRIVTFGSAIAGSMGVPFASPMSATKQAVEAISDSLRREVEQFGVRVVCIQPGFGGDLGDEDGSLVDNDTEITISIAAWPTLRSLYETPYRAMMSSMSSLPPSSRGRPVKTIPEAVHDALTLFHPPTRIRIGPGSWKYPFAGRWVPERVLDWILRANGYQHESAEARNEKEDDEFEKV